MLFFCYHRDRADSLELRAPDPTTARSVLSQDGYAAVEVHRWQFGGRP